MWASPYRVSRAGGPAAGASLWRRGFPQRGSWRHAGPGNRRCEGELRRAAGARCSEGQEPKVPAPQRGTAGWGAGGRGGFVK